MGVFPSSFSVPGFFHGWALEQGGADQAQALPHALLKSVYLLVQRDQQIASCDSQTVMTVPGADDMQRATDLAGTAAGELLL